MSSKTQKQKFSGKPVATQKKSRKIKINPAWLICITGSAVIAAVGFIGIKSTIEEDKRLNDIYYEDYCRKKLIEHYEEEKYQVITPLPSGKSYDDVAEHFKKAKEDRVHNISLIFDAKTGQQMVKITYVKGRNLRERYEEEMYQVTAPMPRGKAYDDVAEHFKKAEEDRVRHMSLELDKRTGQQMIKITYVKGR